ncbi:MAG TPA: chemotaxis protein CheW [Pseudomonadales bacterium]
MANEPNELSCVVIPLENVQLLLPNVCVAEILPWRRVKALSERPPWCLGLLGWRGEMIPVIRFETLNGKPASPRKGGRCMVVMNRTRNANGLPFYALAAEGLPRLVQLTADDLSNAATRLGPAESVVVKLGTETAVIPNLTVIETAVAKLLG